MSQPPTGPLGENAPPAEADWALVRRVQAGDDDAFDELMNRFKGPLHAFVFRMLGNAAEAEDLAADVFVRAYQAIRGQKVRAAEGAFSTWLFQVARNATLDRLRYRKRHPTEPLALLDEDGDRLAARAATPAAEAIAAETGHAIAAAVALLPEEQRTAVLLAEYDQWSHAEIARVLRCSPKSVETRLYRARRFLRERLAHLLPG